MILRKLAVLIFTIMAAAGITAVPAGATTALYACDSIIFNACFYPKPSFQGPEYRTTIYYPGCFTLPPSRSYHTDVPVTVYSERDCTGESAEIAGYFGFDIGFDAQSYLH